MKSLNTYLSEKLVINKNFKNVAEYFSEPYGDTGKCIYVVIPTVACDTQTIGLSSKVHDYKQTNKGIIIDYGNNMSDKIIKNEDGLYIVTDEDNTYYDWFILFEEAALNFLSILLDDPEYSFNIDCFKDSRLKLKTGIFKCKATNFEEFFRKNMIEAMIEEIKDSMKH